MMMSEQNVQRDELIIVTGPHHEAKHAIGDDGSTARRGIHARTQARSVVESISGSTRYVLARYHRLLYTENALLSKARWSRGMILA